MGSPVVPGRGRASSPLPVAHGDALAAATHAEGAGAAAGAGAGGGAAAAGAGSMRIVELRSQKSLRRTLQKWRSMRWLSRGDINLDDSLSQDLLSSGVSRWRRLFVRRPIACSVGLALAIAVVAVVGVVLNDAVRLLPCMKAGATCFNLALAEFQDICDFEALPVRLTTTAYLPRIYSKLHVQSAGFEVGIRNSGMPPVGGCTFDHRNAVGSMTLTGGTQNLTVDTVLNVRNGTGMGMIFSLLLNEVDFQVEIDTHIKVAVETPLFFQVPVAMQSTFFLTCAHLPCKAAACKYVCQFGDYPMKDPDASTPFPYVTRVEKVRLGYDEDGRYTISPEIHVWLSEFKAATVFPRSVVDMYFYNHTKPGSTTGFRQRADLDEDHKLFQVTMHDFVLRSLEASGGDPFLMKMDLRMYNDTPGQAATARDFTTRFLRKDPLYVYLAATPVDKTCPKLRSALLTVPPAGLSLNTNTSTKDGSDSSLTAIGAISDVFRVNALDLFSLNNTIMRSFVNITLMLPFALEGELPMLDMDGFAGPDLIGHFRAFPLTLPPVQRRQEELRKPPMHSFGKEPTGPMTGAGGVGKAPALAAPPAGEATFVMFTEAELSPVGVQRLETIFPDFLTRLEGLDIDLLGSPAPEGNVVQAFLDGVAIKLSSLEDTLVSRGDKAQGGRLFYTPENSPIKPRVHLEVKSITYEHSHDSGLLAYVNFTYPDAFQGRFDIRGGSMHFLLADDNSTALATVTVLDSILSRELTHLEAEIFIADYTQAEAVHNLIDTYSKEMPAGLRILDGVVDSSLPLKEQVPIEPDRLQEHCAEDIDKYCPGMDTDATRACLSQEIGSRVLSHECLKTVLPRGAMDFEIKNLARFVDIGRGIANGVMDRMQSSASKVAVNLVEVLSLRTPEAPMDLQMILEEDKRQAPEGTQVEVTARTNLSIGLLDIIDLTYTVPPLSIGIAAPLTAEDAAANASTSLFTLAIPAMDKSTPRGPIVVESSVRIANIYHATMWLEGLLADLQDKYVIAQPLSTGDVWSYMAEPLRLKVDVLTAINSTTLSEGIIAPSPTPAPGEPGKPAKPATILQTSNETWSKIFFRAASSPDVIVTETKLAFSRPWTEAIDVRVPPMKMSVFTTFVQEGGNRGSDSSGPPLLTDATLCSVDPQKCHLGHFKAGTFRTQKGQLVTVNTNLNMTAEDDGRFWAGVLSDYVAGARVGLWLKSEHAGPVTTARGAAVGEKGAAAAAAAATAAATATSMAGEDEEEGEEGPGYFEMDATIVLPKLPALNIPLNDLVNEVGVLSRRALAEKRQLSLSEIWASLDPIILSVTQPVSIKIDTIKLCNFESPPLDLANASSIAFGADVIARSVVSIPDTLEVDLHVPPLSMNIYSGSLAEVQRYEQQPQAAASGQAQALDSDPWASAKVSDFVFNSKRDNASETALHVDLLHLKRAMDMAETVLVGGQNVTVTIAGAHDATSDSLFSRIFSHMKVQLDLSSRETPESRKPKTINRTGKERLFVTASVSSSGSELVVDGDVFVPKAINPLVMTILTGAMELTLTVRDVPTPIAVIAVDPVVVSQDTDVNVGVRVVVPASGLETVANLRGRVQRRETVEVVLEGTVANQDLPRGSVRTSLVLTPELMEKWGLFRDGSHLLKLPLEKLLNPSFPFHIDNVGLVGGEEVGSDVDLPCLLKGWCDGGLFGGGGAGELGGTTWLKAVVTATVTRLSEFLGLPDGFFGASVSLPAVALHLGIDPSSPSLGRVVVEPFTLAIRDGMQLSMLAQAEMWDRRGLQDTVLRLWQAPFTATLSGDVSRQDVLSRLLAMLPVAVEVPGPASPAEAIESLRTLPTVCDGRWTIEHTTADGFTARVDLPRVTSPVPLTLDRFSATVYYKGVPVLEASTRDGSFYLGPQGGTSSLVVRTAPPSSSGGCPYPTSKPELCLLGEALGKIMTFGDSGPFRGEIVLTYQNPWFRDRTQTVRMPIQLYGAGGGATSMLHHNDYTPPPPKAVAGGKGLRCAAASEMVQELYINLEDTVGASLQFWKSVEVALKVYMVNIFAFPLDVSHLRLTMYFRDPDGVPEDRPASFLSYPPSFDYCLLYDVDLPTPGLSIAPGQGQWTPLLRPRMDEQKLVESLSRLFDEVIVHKRLCADMLDSVIGVAIRGGSPDDAPFTLDLPVSIRSIPFYRADACSSMAQVMKTTTTTEAAGGEDGQPAGTAAALKEVVVDALGAAVKEVVVDALGGPVPGAAAPTKTAAAAAARRTEATQELRKNETK